MKIERSEVQRFLGSLRHEVDKVFESVFTGWRRGEGEEPVEPATDVIETDDTVIIRIQVPGMSKEQLELEMTPEALTLKGELKDETAEKAKQYHRQEIQYGPVRRTVRFPVPVESDKATATLNDGLLQVTVPKSHQAHAQPVKIAVA
jgi:HSP20 family protein